HHTNWAPLVSRLSYGITEESIGEISLFNLVKVAMRMRPDTIVLGEVRGEEAYALFQAISTGHGGISTLHAEDAKSAIQRLTSKPMDVAPSYLSFLDLVYSVRRVAIPNPADPDNPKIVRRMISLEEIFDVNKSLKVFSWDPLKDEFQSSVDKSLKLRKFASDRGKTMREVLFEINNRIQVLQWLRAKNIRNYIELSTIFSQYHNDPESVLQRIRQESVSKSGTEDSVPSLVSEEDSDEKQVLGYK
ncbi:MAG: ATPase, T2SS/T4P/T4SS family, partial [Nitrososphaerales archaeon]